MSRRYGIAPYIMPPTITAASRFALTSSMMRSGSAAPASGTSPWSDAANTVIAFPFVLPVTTPIYKVFWVNGSAAGGNSDIAIYDENYNFLVGTGAATAGSGNSVPQVVALSATTWLSPGLYYAGMAHSATTINQVFRWSVATIGTAIWQALGCWKFAQTLPISGNATPADLTNVALPYFGLITRSGFDV